jgi:shikimate dehydrogenase
MIDGKTRLIVHIGYPTESFKSSMIYNPWFAARKINAAVIPMGCKVEDYASFLKLVFRLTNVDGALITMPHKVTTLDLVDEASVSAKIAGACNAVRLDERGTMIGDMFDGEGFVRCVRKKGRRLGGASALVAGCGGVGSAIAASLAKAGIARLGLYDAFPQSMSALAERLRAHYPKFEVTTASADPAGYDIVINATPLGMKKDDPLPLDVERIAPSTFVGEVVMKEEITPFLTAARAKGCDYQVGTDMLFEQIPAYLEFFGFGTTTSDELRKLAQIHY